MTRTLGVTNASLEPDVFIDTSGFSTQHEPMSAVAEIIRDWVDGHVTHKEALGIIYAITEEWQA